MKKTDENSTQGFVGYKTVLAGTRENLGFDGHAVQLFGVDGYVLIPDGGVARYLINTVKYVRDIFGRDGTPGKELPQEVGIIPSGSFELEWYKFKDNEVPYWGLKFHSPGRKDEESKTQETYVINTTIHGGGGVSNMPDLSRISKENQGQFVLLTEFLFVPPGYTAAMDSYIKNQECGTFVEGEIAVSLLNTDALSVGYEMWKGGLRMCTESRGIFPTIEYHDVYSICKGIVDEDFVRKISSWNNVEQISVTVFSV